MKVMRTVLCLIFLARAVGARFTVEENSDSSILVGSVQRDGGSDYSFQEKDGFFIIDASSGAIHINGTLDRERVAELYGKDLLTYTINYLEDGGRSSFNIEIQVEDVNDNPPRFNLPPSVALLSNQVGPVLQLQASDPDRGENATVDFAITGGNEAQLFELLSPAEGDVSAQTNDRLSLTANPPTGQVFSLQLSATDRGTPEPKSTVVTLQVNISAAANDVPVFAQSSYHFRVPTSAVRGHTVGVVSAMDPDSLINSTIIYYLDQSHFAFAEANTAFSVNRERGIIQLKQVVPTLTVRISFVVIAENTHSVIGADLRAWTHVHVVFYTGNAPPQIVMVDDSPVPPTFSFPENISSFSLPLLLIKDSDELFNSSVELSPRVNHTFNQRQIGIFTGIMFRITERIDRELIPFIDVTFFATDSQGNTGSVSVTIVITDENDNYPTFEPSEYQKDVNETLVVGSEVLQINASDPDSGANGAVRYYITDVHPPEAAILFHIDSMNGTLILDGQLNYENNSLRVITVHVNASDNGSPPKMASTSVTITVLDVNEAPMFVPDPPRAVDVIYNMASQSTLASFTAQDDDLSDSVSYSISCQATQTKFLDINTQSGDLILHSLPEPFAEPILCTIVAMDDQSPPHSTELNVTVYYINDECSGDPCSNNASCHNTRQGFSCACPSAYIGRRCDVPADPCNVDPCTNGGECVGTPNSTHYVCQCPPGFGGHDCEVEPISFGRSGFAKFSLPSDLVSTGLELFLEFSTASPYGLVYYFQSDGGRFVSLEIVDGRVQLRSSRISGTVTYPAKVATGGRWYRIEVNEKKEELLVVELTGRYRVKTSTSESNHTLGPESSAFHALGGVPNIREVPNRLSAYDFVGCIGHVVVNGYLLEVAMPTKSHAMETSCDKWTSPTISVLPLLTSSCIVCNNVDVDVCNYVLRRLPQTCSQASSSAESYTGSGHSRIGLKEDFFLYTEVLRRGEEEEQRTARAAASQVDPKFEISLLFASEVDGVLWAAVHDDSYHILSLSSGQLTYFIYYSGKHRLFSLQQQYSDGQWHSVTVIQTTEAVTLRTEVEVDEFAVASIPGVILTNDMSELQVGGVSDEMAAHVNATAKDYNIPTQYSGCLINLTINHLLIPLDEAIDGVTEVFIAPNTFSSTASCPSLYITDHIQLEFILTRAIPPASVLLVVIFLVVVVFCCVCTRCRRRKSKFEVNGSSSELGNEPTSMVSYNDEGGEFHPDEDKDKKQRTIGEFHMTQASIDSPTITASQRMQFPMPSSPSQETGFHSDMPVLGGSSTDVKESDYSDADESTVPQSDNENGGQSRHAVKQMNHTRRKQTRIRHGSLTSNEEQVLDPLHLRETRVLSPSIGDNLDRLDALPKIVRPSAPLPLTPPTYQGEEHHLKSLSAAHVTPINYWEEAYRMKPAVDTDEQSLHLSQLINEPFWAMESPSPCTSVVSSALEDGRHFSRHHTFNSQGGVEDEAGMDNISMGTDDSINRYGRYSSNRQRAHNFNTPPYHRYYQGRIPFNSRSAVPFPLHNPVGLPRREPLYPHQELPHLQPLSPSQHFSASSSPPGYMSQGKGSGRSPPRKPPTHVPSPLRDYSQGSPRSQPLAQQEPGEFSPMRHNFRNSHALAVSPKVSPAQVAVANGDVHDHTELLGPVNGAHRPSSQPLLDEDETFDRLGPYYHFHQTSSLDRYLGNSTRPRQGEPSSAVDV